MQRMFQRDGCRLLPGRGRGCRRREAAPRRWSVGSRAAGWGRAPLARRSAWSVGWRDSRSEFDWRSAVSRPRQSSTPITETPSTTVRLQHCEMPPECNECDAERDGAEQSRAEVGWWLARQARTSASQGPKVPPPHDGRALSLSLRVSTFHLAAAAAATAPEWISDACGMRGTPCDAHALGRKAARMPRRCSRASFSSTRFTAIPSPSTHLRRDWLFGEILAALVE